MSRGRVWVLPPLHETHPEFEGHERAQEPASRFRSGHVSRLGLLSRFGQRGS